MEKPVSVVLTLYPAVTAPPGVLISLPLARVLSPFLVLPSYSDPVKFARNEPNRGTQSEHIFSLSSLLKFAAAA